MTEKQQERKNMIDFFLSIWKIKPHKSEISGKFLGYEPLTIFFHHILPSRKYPEAKYDPENIILLTFLEHQKVEQDIYFYEEINNRRNQLKIKYNI